MKRAKKKTKYYLKREINEGAAIGFGIVLFLVLFPIIFYNLVMINTERTTTLLIALGILSCMTSILLSTISGFFVGWALSRKYIEVKT